MRAQRASSPWHPWLHNLHATSVLHACSQQQNATLLTGNLCCSKAVGTGAHCQTSLLFGQRGSRHGRTCSCSVWWATAPPPFIRRCLPVLSRRLRLHAALSVCARAPSAELRPWRSRLQHLAPHKLTRSTLLHERHALPDQRWQNFGCRCHWTNLH